MKLSLQRLERLNLKEEILRNQRWCFGTNRIDIPLAKLYGIIEIENQSQLWKRKYL
jgi:hypothetical protein